MAGDEEPAAAPARAGVPRPATRRYYRRTTTRPRTVARPRATRAVPVRVIAFSLTVSSAGGGTRDEHYRLVTTLLDPAAAPARELAAAYARRWAVETAFAELKTYL